MNCFGLKQYSFDNDYTTEKLDDGKSIIETFKNEDIAHISARESMVSVRQSMHSVNVDK